MIVNFALYLLQLSSAKKWKNRHLKQCSNKNIARSSGRTVRARKTREKSATLRFILTHF